MSLKDLMESLKGLEGRLLEDEIYKIVWEEITSNQLDPISQARAISEGGDSQAAIQTRYIRNRVRRIKDEMQAEAALVEAEHRRQQDQKRQQEKDLHNWELVVVICIVMIVLVGSLFIS